MASTSRCYFGKTKSTTILNLFFKKKKTNPFQCYNTYLGNDVVKHILLNFPKTTLLVPPYALWLSVFLGASESMQGVASDFYFWFALLLFLLASLANGLWVSGTFTFVFSVGGLVGWRVNIYTAILTGLIFAPGLYDLVKWVNTATV